MQLAFTCLVYPALILAYMGQAAYLSKHHDFYSSSQVGFYIAVPGMPCHWPLYFHDSSMCNLSFASLTQKYFGYVFMSITTV